jgi:predicted nucleotidyltransferase
MSPARRHALKPALVAALQAVAAALADWPVPGMIIGGIAVIAQGVPRLTRDVDLTLAGGTVGLSDILGRLREHDLVPRIDDAVEFAEANQILLLRHGSHGVDVDLSIAWLPFELEALAASEVVGIAGVQVRVARAEDLIIYKAVAFRPQDQQDIERLLVLHGTRVDLTRIRRTVAEFAQAMEEPERVAGLDLIVRRVGLA